MNCPCLFIGLQMALASHPKVSFFHQICLYFLSKLILEYAMILFIQTSIAEINKICSLLHSGKKKKKHQMEW